LLDDILMLGMLFGTARSSKLKQIQRNIPDWYELHDGFLSKFVGSALGWGMKKRCSKGYVE